MPSRLPLITITIIYYYRRYKLPLLLPLLLPLRKTQLCHDSNLVPRTKRNECPVGAIPCAHMIPVSVKQTLLRRNIYAGTISFQSTKSGAGKQFQLQDCRAKARTKGVFLFTDTGMVCSSLAGQDQLASLGLRPGPTVPGLVQLRWRGGEEGRGPGSRAAGRRGGEAARRRGGEAARRRGGWPAH